MRVLSEEGRRVLAEIAARYGVGTDAAEHLLMAVIAGHTTQAQFNHPDLGGMGQWSQGGMIMVGDMFNNGLKAKVDGLCTELAALARTAEMLPPPMSQQSQSQYSGSTHSGGNVSLFVPGAFSSRVWWPEELGHAASTGAQNNLRYAFFPVSRRLAIDINGKVTVYDTKDHQIGGFSQQQSGDQSLSFTSQYGLVSVSDLDAVETLGANAGKAPKPQEPAAQPPHHRQAAAAAASQIEPERGLPKMPFQPAPQTEEDIFGKIERLAALHAKGILTDEEFSAKKKELLDRI